MTSYIHDIMDKSMMSWVGVVCDVFHSHCDGFHFSPGFTQKAVDMTNVK